ncbi:hypothetical protein K491DRAFT_778302 [Lophiostoma macrostomum CBS 122681]|uniref:F-box domain-containing protein n=1 Tax=Lophiostoma macrostomum CBS 122681 TaxID=1314788 RepID=A0A6A6T9W1_9PLEO|nr:hypothetical protein K491DRAFT_778302 [Lophiostoma macrostomum CBS 122681]
MKLVKGRRKASPPGRSGIDRLHDDALHLVLEQLFPYDLDDLLMVSRVCRRLYLEAVPWIYRHVKIDFSMRSHIRLLSRLAQGGTEIPRYIRMVRILPTNEWDTQELANLYTFFSKLTHLEELLWNNVASIPPFLLAILCVKLPKARLNLQASALGTLPLFRGFDNHLAMHQLTRFSLFRLDLTVSLLEFKIHLVNLIVGSPALSTFDIVIDSMEASADCPNLTYSMLRRKLPQLKRLRLSAPEPIFRPEELALWGLQAGWDELKYLTLGCESELAVFIGMVPKLHCLKLAPRYFRNSQLLEQDLDTELGAPLGPVQKLEYSARVGDVNGLVPWYLLKKMSDTVEELDIAHFAFSGRSPEFDPPTEDDVRRIRALCPYLHTLALDVRFDKGNIRQHVLDELALFEDPITLKIYLHRPNMKDRNWSRSDALDCYFAWKSMIKVRRARNLPITSTRRVDFKVVRPWEKLEEEYMDVDFFCQLEEGSDRHGEVYFPYATSTYHCTPERQNLMSQLSADGLKKLRKQLYKQKAGRFLMRRSREVMKTNVTLEAVEKQRQRNEYNKRAEAAFGTGFTLYDKCACSWTLDVNYARCSHAEIQDLFPPQCPSRMKRKHEREELCTWCRTGDRSLGLSSGGSEDGESGDESDEDENDLGRRETENGVGAQCPADIGRIDVGSSGGEGKGGIIWAEIKWSEDGDEKNDTKDPGMARVGRPGSKAVTPIQSPHRKGSCTYMALKRRLSSIAASTKHTKKPRCR